MSLPLPRLDDRTYAQLVQEGVALIPRYAPGWTNHNASDPGITLVELFAFLTESYLYRVDRVTDRARLAFLRLLVGHADDLGEGADLDAAVRRAAAESRDPFRAVSAADYERVAWQALGDIGDRAIANVHVYPRRDLTVAPEARRDRPGHVSVLLVPADARIPDGQLDACTMAVVRALEPRRLLTTRVHVVGPRYVDATVHVEVSVRAGHPDARAVDRIQAELLGFFDARSGGPDGTGWPIGRSVYAFDLHRPLRRLDEVARVRAVRFDLADPLRLQRADSGEVVGVRVPEDGLLRPAIVVRTDG
jgi:hypothetical protein